MDTTLRSEDTSKILKVALYCVAGMIVYFLLMQFAGLLQRVELHFLNLIIMFAGIYSVLKSARSQNKGKLEFLQGMTTGFLLALMTAVIYGLFVFIYFSYFNPELLDQLKNNLSFGPYLSPGALALLIVLEGASSGAILSFAMIHVMNREKR